MTGPDVPAAEPDPFDLAGFQALPRLDDLAVSPDGTRAVVRVSAPGRDGTRFMGSLWTLDPTGTAPARRLTRSDEGESRPVFTPAGDLLFVSGRAVPDADDDHEPTSLWLLPAGGGEARPVITRPGGVAGVAVAREAGTVLVVAATLPSSTSEADDALAVTGRRQAKVTAILHRGFPVRFWDHDLGPAGHRLFVATPPADPGTDPDGPWTLRDLTGDVGRALDDADPVLTADGTTVLTTWHRFDAGGVRRPSVVVLDVATGAVRALADAEEYEYSAPQLSPDGRTVAMLRERRSTATQAAHLDVVTVPLVGGPVRCLTEGWDGWPHTLRWSADGATLLVDADLAGRGPLFGLDVDREDADGAGSSSPRRLTADDAAYPTFEPLPDGGIVALRNAVDAPPSPVLVGADGTVSPLPGPAAPLEVPGTLTEVTTTAADGTPLRAWLVLPPGASAQTPAPLVLWIHGGPLSSWNTWSWRWNPWLLARRGWAVLLPDPALSTGYGPAMIDRGWGAWGAAPYTDLMAVTDAALAHEAVDADRVAAMGGSFGGYMANWIAGHTDRFAAVVTHASLWNLDSFGATTDAAWYWNRELTPEAAHENSPHRFAAEITTPMLVIHGDRDFRVPIGEGLALWWALQSATPHPGDHQFLYFPDENHWVLTPNHARVWYETVLAFLDHHVLGEQWIRPERLG